MTVADDLLSISDLKTKRITVPQWKREIVIKELGLLPIMEMYQSMNLADVDSGKIEVKPLDIAKIVSLGVVDDSGNQVFTEEHIPALAKKNRAALMFIYGEIMSLSGADEDIEKN